MSLNHESVEFVKSMNILFDRGLSDNIIEVKSHIKHMDILIVNIRIRGDNYSISKEYKLYQYSELEAKSIFNKIVNEIKDIENKYPEIYL